MLIGIYFVLRNIVFSTTDLIESVITLIGVVLIMGFGISLMGNALTRNSHSTDAYTNGVRTLGGRILRGLFTGIFQLFRIVFYRAPRWVYRRTFAILEAREIGGEGVRTLISSVAALVTVIILV